MLAVLITGANRGIGLEFARQYATEGWRVLACWRNPKTATQLAKLANSSRGKLVPLAIDVTDGESVRTAARELGDQTIDLLINNAGIAGVPGQRTGHIDYENWAHVLNVNTLTMLFRAFSGSASAQPCAAFGSLLGPLARACQALAADRLDERLDVIAAVVIGDLVPQLDVPDRTDLDRMLDEIDLGIGPARVVDVARPVPAGGAIDGPARVDLEEIAVTKVVGSFGVDLPAAVAHDKLALADRYAGEEAQAGF